MGPSISRLTLSRLRKLEGEIDWNVRRCLLRAGDRQCIALAYWYPSGPPFACFNAFVAAPMLPRQYVRRRSQDFAPDQPVRALLLDALTL